MLFVVQLSLCAALIATAVERTRALCFVGAYDEPSVAPVLIAMPRETLERLTESQALVVRALLPALLAEVDEREIALEESLFDIRREIAFRMMLLRIGATCSSLSGLVGAAIAIGAMRLEGGSEQALADGSLAIALGIGGSSFALGVWMALRTHARARLAECERAAERLRLHWRQNDTPPAFPGQGNSVTS